MSEILIHRRAVDSRGPYWELIAAMEDPAISKLLTAQRLEQWLHNTGQRPGTYQAQRGGETVAVVWPGPKLETAVASWGAP